MRLTTLPALTLGLASLTACVAPVGGDQSGRGRNPTGECDLDSAKVVTKDLTLRSAEDIDEANLPGGCWDLDGTLRIESPNITSLAGLGKLAAVTNLELVNTKLTKLDFAEPVTVYEKLDVRNNQTLGTLDKLLIEQDRAVGITIQDNPMLTSLEGLVDLTKVEGGDFVIRGNAKLATLSLPALNEVTGRFEISDNGALVNVDGLSELATIGGELTIYGNAKLETIKLPRFTAANGPTRISNNAALTSIDVANLETVKRFEISDNQGLKQFSGFRAQQIGGDLMVRNNKSLGSLGSMFSLDSILGQVTIDNNAALTTLGTFTLTLRNVTSTLTVSNNPQLGDLGQISHMNGIAGSVSIANNTKLPYCKALEIDHCVATGAVSIVGNLNTQTTNCDCWCD